MAKREKRQHPPVSTPPKPSPLRESLAELDRLLEAHQSRRVDDWDAAPKVRELAERIGSRRAFEELVNRLQGPDGEVRPSVLWALGLLGGQAVVPRLWEVIRNPNKSLAARRAARVAIEKLGGKVDTAELPDDLIQRMYGHLGRLAEVLEEIEEADSPIEVEMALGPFHRLMGMPGEGAQPSGKEMAIRLVDMVPMYARNRAGADFLQAVVDTTLEEELRQEAEKALSSLRLSNVEAASPAVLGLRGLQFYRALSGPVQKDPSKSELVAAWKSGEDKVTAMTFIIDRQNVPGSLLDVDLDEEMTEQEFRRRFIEQPWLAGEPMRELPLQEARDLVTRGLEVNERHGRGLPAKYQSLRSIIERWLLRAGQ